VKIVRKMPDYYDLAKIEVDILEKLNELDPDGKRSVPVQDLSSYLNIFPLVFFLFFCFL
jgi:hypothetical protein